MDGKHPGQKVIVMVRKVCKVRGRGGREGTGDRGQEDDSHSILPLPFFLHHD